MSVLKIAIYSLSENISCNSFLTIHDYNNLKEIILASHSIHICSQGNTHVLTDKFDLTNVNNMVFYISGTKLLFETTEISTHPNSTRFIISALGSAYINDCEKYTTEAFYLLIYLSEINFH
jgi:hypothetical protein